MGVKGVILEMAVETRGPVASGAHLPAGHESSEGPPQVSNPILRFTQRMNQTRAVKTTGGR